MSSLRRTTLAGILLLALFLAAGCGGSDKIATPEATPTVVVETSTPPVSETSQAAGDLSAWAVGNKGVTVATDSSGSDWSDQIPLNGGPGISAGRTQYSVSFVDSSHGWSVGEFDSIRATVDGGETWISRYPSQTVQSSLGDGESSFNGVWFADTSRGWVVSGSGAVLATVDGGRSWRVQKQVSGVVFSGVVFANGKHGWAVGSGPMLDSPVTVLATSDGGASWKLLQPGVNGSLAGVACTGSSRVWAVGWDPDDRGFILKSDDGGASWSRADVETDYHVNGIAFSDPATGWAVGGPMIMSTADGGSTWTETSLAEQGYDSYENLTSVAFADSSNGWVVGASGTVYATSDGGSTWTNAYSVQGTGQEESLWGLTCLRPLMTSQ